MGCASGSLLQPVFRDAYQVREKLGAGAFGVVYQVAHKKTGRILAVKMIDRSMSTPKEVEAEIQFLKEFDHENVNKIVEVFEDKCFMYVVTEQYLGGDILDGLQRYSKAKKGHLPENHLQGVLRQLAMSLKYIHGKEVIHRDIKGDNYLMDRMDIADPECRFVLSDFGTATHLPLGKCLSYQTGTSKYWAPEVLSRKYAHGADVWALGVSVYGLVSGKFPFSSPFQVEGQEPKTLPSLSDNCWSLLGSLLAKDPKARPSGEDILNHSFLATTVAKVDEDSEVSAFLQSSSVLNLREDLDAEVIHRRQHLVGLLDQEHGLGPSQAKGRLSVGSASSQAKGGKGRLAWQPTNFTIDVSKQEGKQIFEWWSPEKCKEKMVENFLVCEDRLADGSAAPVNVSPDVLKELLIRHEVDVESFGQGSARTLRDFLAECLRGEATLGQVQGKLLRVVDVVIIRVRNSPGGKLLVEKSERFPDGRTREWNRLPGLKRRPHESPRIAGLRVLDTMLGLQPNEVMWTSGWEILTEQQASPSYPAVETLYRKHITDCVIRGTIAAARKGKMGLSGDKNTAGNATFETQAHGVDGSQGASVWAWHSDKQCKKLGMTICGSTEASSFVAPAPASALTASSENIPENLIRRFGRCGIDVSLFGCGEARSIADIAGELERGLCTLEEQEVEGSTPRLLRVINHVAVRLCDPVTENLLVMARVELPDGREKAQPQLPAMKPRAHENSFHSARRFITTTLKIPDEDVTFKTAVETFGEERELSAYPGLTTLFRKQIIEAVVGDTVLQHSVSSKGTALGGALRETRRTSDMSHATDFDQDDGKTRESGKSGL